MMIQAIRFVCLSAALTVITAVLIVVPVFIPYLAGKLLAVAAGRLG